MIKNIDISKFGVFDNYNWNNTIGANEGFRKLNIIYGRNYAGKTTLSRIFRCVEMSKLHNQYNDAYFNINFYGGQNVNQDNVSSEITDFIVRVYNTDFVRDNLSWLYNDDGSIQPFTILGAKNIELDKQISLIDEDLGDINKQGLLQELNVVSLSYNSSNAQLEENIGSLNNRLRIKAAEIKTETLIYNYPTYQITHIKKDLARELTILNEQQIEELKNLLKEEPKANIPTIPIPKANFQTYYNETKILIANEISPTKPILDLISDNLLQEWVRHGMTLHKSVRETCGFCGNVLTDQLWQDLNSHFNQESDELRKKVEDYIAKLNDAKDRLQKFSFPSKDKFYLKEKEQINELEMRWNGNREKYISSIDSLISHLDIKQKDIFKSFEIVEVEDFSEKLIQDFIDLNIIIEENNDKTLTLNENQEDAREKLRLSEIGKFARDIEYETTITDIELLKEEVEGIQRTKDALKSKVDTKIEERRKLESEAKDESKGAELVNNHLTHFFGHQELKLVAEEDEGNLKFKIIRNQKYATNLSEGESSLISFCYFIARLQDELNEEHHNKKLIIYIDDPISSLDNNHIFFIFSLIEAIIARPKKYLQLFISTHNLDFLKYLRKLTEPEKFKFSDNSKDRPGLANFILERNKSTAKLSISPEYLRNYITEFNYLFNQIYQCSTLDIETISHDFQYNFGNNMRKFLEAYLFYKYPSHKLNLEKRLAKFFAEDMVSISLVNRVINEYSHLGDNFERGLEPLDSNSVHLVSKAVMERINKIDSEQFAALVESITPMAQN